MNPNIIENSAYIIYGFICMSQSNRHSHACNIWIIAAILGLIYPFYRRLRSGNVRLTIQSYSISLGLSVAKYEIIASG